MVDCLSVARLSARVEHLPRGAELLQRQLLFARVGLTLRVAELEVRRLLTRCELGLGRSRVCRLVLGLVGVRQELPHLAQVGGLELGIRASLGALVLAELHVATEGLLRSAGVALLLGLALLLCLGSIARLEFGNLGVTLGKRGREGVNLGLEGSLGGHVGGRRKESLQRKCWKVWMCLWAMLVTGDGDCVNFFLRAGI